MVPIKYQENAKKFGTEIPNTDLVLVFSWYTKFWVTDRHHYSVHSNRTGRGTSMLWMKDNLCFYVF